MFVALLTKHLQKCPERPIIGPLSSFLHSPPTDMTINTVKGTLFHIVQTANITGLEQPGEDKSSDDYLIIEEAHLFLTQSYVL